MKSENNLVRPPDIVVDGLRLYRDSSCSCSCSSSSSSINLFIFSLCYLFSLFVYGLPLVLLSQAEWTRRTAVLVESWCSTVSEWLGLVVVQRKRKIKVLTVCRENDHISE